MSPSLHRPPPYLTQLSKKSASARAVLGVGRIARGALDSSLISAIAWACTWVKFCTTGMPVTLNFAVERSKMSTQSGEPHYEVSPAHQHTNGETDAVTSVNSFTSFSSAEGASVDMKRYRDLPHRSSNEALKAHTNFSVRLSDTGELLIDTTFALLTSCAHK